MNDDSSLKETSSTDGVEETSDHSLEEENVSPKEFPEQFGGDSIPFLLLVDKIADRAEPLIDVVQSIANQYKESRKDRVEFRLAMTYVAVGLVLAIVLIAAFLTYFDKLDGSTFGFLLGLIIGYLLTFVRDAIGVTSTDEF